MKPKIALVCATCDANKLDHMLQSLFSANDMENDFDEVGLFIALDSEDGLMITAPYHDAPKNNHDVFITWNKAPRGISCAFNDAINVVDLLKYDYLMILEDAISFTERDIIKRLIAVLEKHPEFGWVAPGQVENPSATFTAMCSVMSTTMARRMIIETNRKARLFDDCLECFDDADLIRASRSVYFFWTADGHRIHNAFDPHGVPDIKISHPESRTTTAMLRGGRDSEQEREHFLQNQKRFRCKWHTDDFDWSQVPQYRGD